MSPHDTFLRAVIENPDDDAPRLVYADWLDEQGDPRGEFIHAQCEMGRQSCCGVPYFKLRRKALRLLRRHGREWVRPFQGLVRRSWFRRGFVEQVAAAPERYAAAVASLPTLTPVRRVLVELTGVTIPDAVVELLPESLAREHILMPVGTEGHRLLIAAAVCSGPVARQVIDTVRFTLNRPVELLPAFPESIPEAIDRHYGRGEVIGHDFMLAGEVDAVEEFLPYVEDEDPEVNALVDVILREAVTLGATAIRIEPRGEGVHVCFRVRGELVTIDWLDAHQHAPLLTHIRTLAGMGPDAPRGKITVAENGVVCEMTVSITQTSLGPCVVIRVQRPAA
jgi:type IV pilus assembly protein PilB